MGKGEDHVVVCNAGNKFGVTFHDPFLLKGSLTAGTVTVIAGTAVDLFKAALRALGNGIAKFAGFAVGDTESSFRLFVRNKVIFRVRRIEVLEGRTDGIIQDLAGICVEFKGHKDSSHSSHCQYQESGKPV